MHHCSFNGKCVTEMDHHCPWVNNCIGLHNFRYFLQFKLSMFTAILLQVTVFYTFRNHILLAPYLSLMTLQACINIAFAVFLLFMLPWETYLCFQRVSQIDYWQRHDGGYGRVLLRAFS